MPLHWEHRIRLVEYWSKQYPRHNKYCLLNKNFQKVPEKNTKNCKKICTKTIFLKCPKIKKRDNKGKFYSFGITVQRCQDSQCLPYADFFNLKI